MKDNLRRIINIVAVLLCITVIWGFSLKPGRASHEESGKVEAMIINFCRNNNINIDKRYYKIYAPFVEDPNNITTEVAVRKTAHFTEYFVFGLLCAVLSCLNRRKLLGAVYLFMGVLVAYIDERIIQLYFVSNRTSSFKDVALDCIGFYIAYLIITTIMIPFKRKKGRA